MTPSEFTAFLDRMCSIACAKRKARPSGSLRYILEEDGILEAAEFLSDFQFVERTETIAVEFTEDELANVQAAAKRAGLPLNEWLVRMTIDDAFQATQEGAAANGNVDG